jgi:hypothetical protein
MRCAICYLCNKVSSIFTFTNQFSVQGSVQEAVGQNLDTIIILLRLAAQIPRVILFIRNQSKRHKIAKEQAKGIDLTSSNVDLDFTLGETYISERDSVTSNEEEDRKNYV